MKFAHIKKRILCLLLLSLLGICSACGKKPLKEPEIVSEDISIKVNQLGNATLIVQSCASHELNIAVGSLQTAIRDMFGAEVDIMTDITSQPNSDSFEILIGNTNRKETSALAEQLNVWDWGYLAIEKKLVIYSANEDGLLDAVKHFTEHVVKQHKDTSNVFFDNATAKKLMFADYERDALTLHGNEITDYTIVYPEANQTAEELANWVASKIKYTYGLSLDVVSDKEKPKGKEILIGTTNRIDCSYTTQELEQGSYLIGATRKYVCARGADSLEDAYAVRDLIQTLMKDSSEKPEIIVQKTTKKVPDNDQLSAMTFNVYVGTPTAQRQASVLQTILTYLPDTFGVQEADLAWMTYFDSHLKDFYTYVGKGSDGSTRGSYSAIFYRKDRFKLVETKTYWLSETFYFVSKVPESMLNRVYTYALLMDKQTGKEIMVVNTHLDHSGPPARDKQIVHLMDFIKKNTKYPIILTGDFNDNRYSSMYKTATMQLAESSQIAQKSEIYDTFHNYGPYSEMLDYIFVSDASIDVSYYTVIREKENGMFPSDHYPSYIEYTLK